MIINTGNAPDTDAQRPKIASDGKTRIKLGNFNTKQGTQIRITNDERRALLNQFNPKRKLRRSWITIATGVGVAAFGAIFGVIITSFQRVQGNGIVSLCLAALGIPLVIYGVYGISTCPNMEKCNLNAYEFTVEAIETIIINYHQSAYSDNRFVLHSLISVSAAESSQYMPSGENHYPRLILTFGGNRVELCNPESFNVFRSAIAVGDKVRCAVLETEKYCYISVF